MYDWEALPFLGLIFAFIQLRDNHPYPCLLNLGRSLGRACPRARPRPNDASGILRIYTPPQSTMPSTGTPTTIVVLFTASLMLSVSYMILYVVVIKRDLPDLLEHLVLSHRPTDRFSLLPRPTTMLSVIINHVILCYISWYSPSNDLQADSPDSLFIALPNIVFTGLAGCLSAYYHLGTLFASIYFTVQLWPAYPRSKRASIALCNYVIGSGEAIVLLVLCIFYIKARARLKRSREISLQLTIYGTFFEPPPA